MTMKKIPNDYDEIKGLLNKIRKIQSASRSNDYGIIREQIEDNQEPQPPEPDKEYEAPATEDDPVQDPTIKNVPGEEGEEQEDIAVINDVEIEIHSEDPEDLGLSDEEKKQISQLIDDFRTEVSEMVEFDKLHIYDESAKLDGKISDIDLTFTISTGDDTGLYLSNVSMLKIDDESLDMINKLRAFTPKFSNTINDLLVNRSTT